MVEPESDPAGRLNRLWAAARTGLGDVPLRDLAVELRARVRDAALASLHGDVADQLGLLSIELETLADVFGNRFSRNRANELFHMASRFLGAGKTPLAGAAVAEFGCGSVNPLAALLVFVLAGARIAHGFDLDPPQNVPAAVRGLARIATYMLAEPSLLAPGQGLTREAVARHFAGFDLIRLWQGDPAGIDEQRLQLHRTPAEHTGLADASLDFTYSVSFLEHVADPAALVAELARITRRGGTGAHSIDGKDHSSYGDATRHPLDFLRLPAGPGLVRGSNRLRPLQFVALFEAGGFEVVSFDVHERVPVPADLRAGFAAPFRELADDVLGAVGGAIFVRRR